MKYLLTLYLTIFSLAGNAAEFSSFYDRSFSVGGEYRSWDNREFKNGSQLMRDYGKLSGVKLEYRTPFDDGSWLFSMSYSYVSGGTTYDGQLQDGTPYESKSQNKIGILQFDFLKGYSVGQSLIAIHFGIASRILYNDELPEEPADYSRQISYRYLPIGLRFMMPMESGLKLEIDVTYQLFLSGTVKTALSETGSFTSDIENSQNEGMGASASISLSMDMLSFSIYTHYWSIEDSDAALAYGVDTNLYQFYEPENTTKSYGVMLSLQF